jgi:hypothetical protein
LVSALCINVSERRLRCQRAEVENDPYLDRTGIPDSVPGARRDEQRGPGGQFPWLAVDIRRRVPIGNVKELLGIWVVVLGNAFARLQQEHAREARY